MVLPFPLISGSASTALQKSEPVEEHLLPLASNLFERHQIYPGEVAEVMLDELSKTVFMNPLNKHKRIPRRWEDNKYPCIVPRYELAEDGELDDKCQYGLVCNLQDQIEVDCRQLLIAAGQWNTTIYAPLPEIYRKIRSDLGNDCIIFSGWIGPPPHFYTYTVGIKKVKDNLFMPIFSIPELIVYGTYKIANKTKYKAFVYVELGLAVVNHKYISIGKEYNDIK